MENEKDFIEGFLKGDSKLLNEIYKKSYLYVERHILARGGDKKQAEDVFQNALVHLFVKLKEGKLNIKKFDNYLFTVCKNLWKRENSKKQWVTDSDNIPLKAEEYDNAAFYIEQNQWDLFQEKLVELSDNCKELLKMIFDKISYKEIVEHFSYSSQTVARQRVFKCKARLTKLIKEDNRFLSLKK